MVTCLQELNVSNNLFPIIQFSDTVCACSCNLRYHKLGVLHGGVGTYDHGSINQEPSTDKTRSVHLLVILLHSSHCSGLMHVLASLVRRILLFLHSSVKELTADSQRTAEPEVEMETNPSYMTVVAAGQGEGGKWGGETHYMNL